MSKALERINMASVSFAESMFRDCCGSVAWATAMAAERPFRTEGELIEKAAGAFNRLSTGDWLEAFAAHPRIGETKPLGLQQIQSAEWSAGEQAGMNTADELLKEEFVAANRAYHNKFGFIFIVCATGKCADEMLELCKSRLKNDRATEIAIAAAEQQKITEIRLRKLLSS